MEDVYGASHPKMPRWNGSADLRGLSSDAGVKRGVRRSARCRGKTSGHRGDKGVHTQVTSKQVKQLDRGIIRFAGDSGEGMHLTGDRFTQESAASGNDLSTLPTSPAEIRAPQ